MNAMSADCNHQPLGDDGLSDTTNTVSAALIEAGMEHGATAALAVVEIQLREDARIATYQDTFVMAHCA